MGAQTFENSHRESDRIPALVAAHTRPATGADAVNEVLKLPRQLIALIAVFFQNLQLPSYKIVSERQPHSRIESLLNAATKCERR